MTYLLLAAALSGQTLFADNCLSCHGERGAGAFGPNIQGSSVELVTAKTQRGTYPKGYKPKHDTNYMPVIKLTEAEIKSIVEYLK